MIEQCIKCILVLVLLGACFLLQSCAAMTSNHTEFCSFFNNRKPSPQPNLRNCTWFKENSCCKQEEIDATFGTVKPLPGSSKACQRYSNYLMCYICAPYQNVFYRREKLTICEEFCNAWFESCASAILKGSVIGSLYTNGKNFCEMRNFYVDAVINKNCFIFDSSLDRFNSGMSISSNPVSIGKLLTVYGCVTSILYQWAYR